MEAAVLRLGLVLGLLFIPVTAWLSPRVARGLRAHQHIRPEGPVTHAKKAGTPTMGGLAPLLLVLGGSGVIWGVYGFEEKGLFALMSMVLAGGIGLLDDLKSQRRRRSLGLLAHQTLIAQVLAAGILALLAAGFPQALRLPFVGETVALPCWAWIPLLFLGFVGTVNGVNLADGLDGLAAGLFLLSVLGLLPLVLEGESLASLSFLGLGTGLGFLWANVHPARVFLGNVGAMGLGGLLFGLAWGSGGVLFLPLVGGVFVLESVSVILQVASYKLTGMRLFKMSPLHHHLEDVPVPWPHRLKSPNWPEAKVVGCLWIAGAACALLGFFASL